MQEQNNILKQELLQLCIDYKINATRMLMTQRYSHLLQYVIDNTPSIISDAKFPLKMKIFWILNDLKDFPKCKICGKELTYTHYSILNGCKQTCSYACQRKLATQNSKITCLKRYGVTNGGGISTSLEKIRKTCLERYGATNVYASEYGKNISRKTCLKKYGKEHYQSTQEFKNKIKQINKEHFGVEFPLQNKDILRKAENTCLKKYGVKWAVQSNEVSKKVHRKYIYNQMYFDSKPEIAFYIWLSDVKNILDIDFEYQPNIVFQYCFDNKVHFYQPDFKVGDQFFELKGDHFFKDGKMILPFRQKNWSDKTYENMCRLYEAKHQCMVENNIIILSSNSYKFFLNYVNENYGKTFLTQFRKKG